MTAWIEPNPYGASWDNSIVTRRYTLRPPTVLDVTVAPTGDSIVVAFSQKMATDGAGNVLQAANWGLRLADGRYLVQADPQIAGTDPRATPEQIVVKNVFNSVTKKLESRIDSEQIYNSATGRWEVTIPLNFTLFTGSYLLIPRDSLRDDSGRS